MRDYLKILTTLTAINIQSSEIPLTDTNILLYCEDSIFNKATRSVRISIEWYYASTASLFSYLSRKNKLQVLCSRLVSKVYVVSTLLKNFHSACYRKQPLLYFEAMLYDDFLEHYIKQEDFA